jgi:hypothetical protein
MMAITTSNSISVKAARAVGERERGRRTRPSFVTDDDGEKKAVAPRGDRGTKYG